MSHRSNITAEIDKGLLMNSYLVSTNLSMLHWITLLGRLFKLRLWIPLHVILAKYMCRNDWNQLAYFLPQFESCRILESRHLANSLSWFIPYTHNTSLLVVLSCYLYLYHVFGSTKIAELLLNFEIVILSILFTFALDTWQSNANFSITI